MQTYHHKAIKKFYLDGQIGDESALPRLRNEYERLIVDGMRANGYVPRLDIYPDFTLEYNAEKELFLFKLTIYGVYVGKRQSVWITGVDGSKAIYIPKNKSKESSQVQESRLNRK